MNARASILALAALLAAAPGCGEKPLEVRGALDRVIGERVSLELVEGNATFSGDLTLRTADTTIRGDSLQVTKESDRSLSFVIPTGVAQGDAQALAGRADETTPFEVPLHLNRLVLTLDDKGTLESWPLPYATLEPGSRSEGMAGGLIAVTPSGGEVIVAVDGKISSRSLGATIQEANGGLPLSGVLSMAAIPDGALVATADSVILVRMPRGQPATQTGLSLAGRSCSAGPCLLSAKAVAVTPSGAQAVILGVCDSNTDQQPDADCIVEVSLGTTIAESRTTVIDETPGASVVALSRDGTGVVVPDTDFIYGLYIGSQSYTPPMSKIAWSDVSGAYAAHPVGVAQTRALVSASEVDLFAVAESARNRIYFVAFNPTGNTLQKTLETLVPAAPTGLGFGRQNNLCVGAGKSIFLIDVTPKDPPIRQLPVGPANTITGFAVQP